MGRVKVASAFFPLHVHIQYGHRLASGQTRIKMSAMDRCWSPPTKHFAVLLNTLLLPDCNRVAVKIILRSDFQLNS